MQVYRLRQFPVHGAMLVLTLVWWALAGQAAGQEPSPYAAARQRLLTLAEQRIASSVRAAARLAAQPEAPRASVMLNRARRAGEVEVYVYASQLTPAEVQQLQQHGGRIYRVHEQFRMVYAALPVAALEAVAALPFVRWLGPPSYSQVRVGSVTSAGDGVMQAEAARTMFGVDGSGVRVGIISDSLVDVQESVDSGDLPPDVIMVNDQDGSTVEDRTDEGRAMAEIVHDLAPGATLLFHSGFPASSDVEKAIKALTTAGAHVIVDDILSFLEPVFEYGLIGRAVQDAIDQGVIYVTAGGNDAGRHYRGTYQEFDPNDGDPLQNYHDFGGGDSTMAVSIAPAGVLFAVLQWPNPFDGSGADDYDLLVYDADGTTALFDEEGDCREGDVRGTCAGLENQAGPNAPPQEAVSLENRTGRPLTVTLRINRAAGAALPLALSFNQDVELLEHHVVRGSVYGQQCVRGALAVGAIAASDAGFNTIEPFSSRGPCEIFFPAFVRFPKPDLIAADRVMTSLPGFRPFAGTSAAAPHVAAVVALLLDAAGGPGGLPPTQIANILRVAAVDQGARGIDNTFGYGVVDVVQAITALQALQAGTNLAPRSTMASPDTDVVIVPGDSVIFQGTCVDADESGPLTFAWDFDGVMSPTSPLTRLQNPGAVMFTNPGTFDIAFTCTDAAGAQAPVVTRRVTVNRPPVSRIDTPLANVSVPEGGQVDFAGTCTDAERHTPFSFLWFFGGGSDEASATSQRPGPIRFDNPGTFTVTFVCIDALGIADRQPATVQVQVSASGGGGGGGGGCSVFAADRRGRLEPLQALGNILLPLVVLGMIRVWSRRRSRSAGKGTKAYPAKLAG